MIAVLTDRPLPQPVAGVGPIVPEERIHALDVLRGWAMFGVLWSNLNDWYATTAPVTTLDHALQWIQSWLLSSRFYTLLAILFGVGFGIQLLRASEQGVEFTRTYYRRSSTLLVIGALHGLLLWNGDILTAYAIVAFALPLFRDLRPARLLIAAAIVLLIVPEIVPRLRFVAGLRFPVPRESMVTADWIFAHGTWAEIAPVRAHAYLDKYSTLIFGLYLSVLGKFLVGLWAVRSGYVKRVIEDRRTTMRLLGWSLVAIGVGFAWYIWFPTLWPPRGDWTGINARFWAPRRLAAQALNWSTEGMALAYAAVLLLIAQSAPGAKLLRPLAAAGRMALTTYLTQSVVCTLLFYGYGFGLYGRTGFTGMFFITIIVFGSQMLASTWWLARFRFGPAEWLWRAMTYGRAPRMRK